MQMMINLKSTFVWCSFFKFVTYFVWLVAQYMVRWSWSILSPVFSSHDTLHFMCSGLTLSNEIADCWILTEIYRGERFGFLYWCMSEVPQGNPVACPPPPPASVLVGRQAEAAASPSWRPWSHCCCCCRASNEMLCQAGGEAFTALLYHLDGRWLESTFYDSF